MRNSETSTQTGSSSTNEPEYITLGPAPANESCAQLGHTPDFNNVAQQECQRYLELIQTAHPKARLAVKAFKHDFGTYYEVVALYSNKQEEQSALEVEAHLPASWTDEEPPVTGILRKRIMERKP
jgi:hypothetical protein